jgi:signal transduction histidine kinase/ActR/RegA family two-component response regulator
VLSTNVRRATAALLSLGEPDGPESADARVRRQTLVLGGALMSGGGLLWGVLAIAIDRVPASAIPFGYVLLTLLNFWVLARTRAYPRAQRLQVFISLLLPFLFQACLGGFVSSGVMMLWAMIALVGSLTMSTVRGSVAWLVVYCAFTIASGLYDPEFAARFALDVPPSWTRWFYVINVVVISSIVFTLGLAITQRQRRAIEALEAGQATNRALNAQLQQALARREDDVARLRAAEAALTAQAEGLEAQVRARTAELQGALVHAEAGTQAKSAFLAVMSHEIRTPLNGILGTADLLQHSTLDEDQATAVRLIRQSGDLLLGIINDVLDFSKIEAGRLELAPRPFDPRAELEGLVGLHRGTAVERGLTVDLDVRPSVPARVSADAGRLLQIVGNLVGNAVKFTHAGAVRVMVDARDEGEQTWLDVTVRDTGIGITPEHVARLFQPFSQADSSTTRRYGGTGLGLAICARLVEVMGGTIDVDSVPGVGTTFRFRVRARRLEAEAEAAERRVSTPQLLDGRPLRVLLAEDNTVNQAVGMRLLKTLGCEATLAADGRAAVDLVVQQPFDLVLMDMQMPEMDGVEATRAIRALALAHRPTIVALTANAYASDRAACLEAGMDDFMAKPLRLEELRALLQRVAAPRGDHAVGAGSVGLGREARTYVPVDRPSAPRPSMEPPS